MDRPSPAAEDAHSGFAPWAVTGLGVLLSLGAILNLVEDLQSDGILAPPVLALVFGLVLSGTVVYAGYWLRASELPDQKEWRVFFWSVGGLATMLCIQGFTVAIRLAEEHAVGDAAFSLLFAADAGAIVGFTSGVLVVRVRQEAAEARRARDAVFFLNRLLRHDILNDLSVVQSHAAILREHVDADGEEWLDTVEAQSKDATDLIRSSRTVTHTVLNEADLEPVELADLLAAELERVGSTFEAAEFDVEVPDDACVVANGALSRVFGNLLSNAVEHNDSETPRVALRVTEAAETMTVCIADNGPGIPDPDKPDVFEAADGGDHGFGLFLADTLVSSYGGRLSVRDNDPRGAVFEVELPRCVEN